MKVLYLGSPNDTFGAVAIERIGAECELVQFDWDAPVAPQMRDASVVVDMGGGHATAEMLAAGEHIRLWQVFGNGVDHFDVALWRERGAIVANCPGPGHAVALAEHAVMGLLMLLRQYPAARRNLLSGVPYMPIGRELRGLRLLTLGFGASARELSVRAATFGVEVSGLDLLPPGEDEARRWGASWVGHVDQLDEQLPLHDAVSIHLPLDDTTHQILDARRLALMSSDAYLINVSRGGLVDQAALTVALQAGQLGGAVLDVFDPEPLDWSSPLMWLPNVIATPHVSGVTHETAIRRSEIVIENIKRVANGDEPLHQVR